MRIVLLQSFVNNCAHSLALNFFLVVACLFFFVVLKVASSSEHGAHNFQDGIQHITEILLLAEQRSLTYIIFYLFF
jgi:hypothetical protein